MYASAKMRSIILRMIQSQPHTNSKYMIRMEKNRKEKSQFAKLMLNKLQDQQAFSCRATHSSSLSLRRP